MTTIHVLLLVLIFAVFPLRCSTDTGDILLSVKGKPCAAIVVSVDAIPAEKTAAKELANHLKLVTGADFPIVSNASQASKGMCIYIGQTKNIK